MAKHIVKGSCPEQPDAKEKFERLKIHNRKALYCPLPLLVNIIGVYLKEL